MYHYYVFGLHIGTEIPLPELVPGDSGTAPDVVITLGTVPSSLPEARYRHEHYEASPERLLLTFDDVARLLIESGQRITIDPAESAHPDLLRLVLLGSALGAILHQRGVLALHGSAVRVGDGCVAFLGRSGIGKSTLATSLMRHGYDLVTDDVCAVSVPEDGLPVVHPGYPQTKLWRDTLEHLQMHTPELRRVHPELEKRALPIAQRFNAVPLPLHRIYILGTSAAPEGRIQPLEGPRKFTVLQRHTYRNQFIDGLGIQADHFKQVTRIAQHLPVALLVRPETSFEPERLIELLEANWTVRR